MGDIFKEQIVKRKQTTKDIAIRICLIILAFLIVAAAAIFLGPQIALFVSFAAFFGVSYLMSFLRIEYEYVFTNGEFDIDVIYNRARRKRVFSTTMKNAEVMAHVEDNVRVGEFSSAQEVRDYSSGEIKANTYAFLVAHNGKYVKVIIEPNEKMLQAIGTVLTRRKLHIRQ